MKSLIGIHIHSQSAPELQIKGPGGGGVVLRIEDNSKIIFLFNENIYSNL